LEAKIVHKLKPEEDTKVIEYKIKLYISFYYFFAIKNRGILKIMINCRQY